MDPAPSLPDYLVRAHHQGREAFLAGGDRMACPYPPDSEEHKMWLASFDAAERFRRILDEHLARQA